MLSEEKIQDAFDATVNGDGQATAIEFARRIEDASREPSAQDELAELACEIEGLSMVLCAFTAEMGPIDPRDHGDEAVALAVSYSFNAIARLAKRAARMAMVAAG